MPFKFTRMEISDLIMIEPQIFEDSRGYFLESYHYSDFSNNGIKANFVQDNCSRSKQGVLRGLHYQLDPVSQGKLVRCLRGEIFDVAVDIRKDSDTYLKWFGLVLSEENMRQLYIPPGFAHGFVTLSEFADVAYKTTNFYSPTFDRGIIWNDSTIGIKWPISEPILSTKDAKLPQIQNAENQ